MAFASQKQLNLHWEILPGATKEAADFLSNQSWMGDFGWYLAGGTALALQVGHRKSVDLDFFTTQKIFEPNEVVGYFEDNKNWETTISKKNTIYGKLLGAKISFIAYPFFIPKQEFLKHGNISILQSRDIAVMKIVAISQRGKKRVFFDLYWCVKNIEPLTELLKRLPAQYPSVAHDYHHILKSMVYFDDAENDPDPEINFKADWKKVKVFFESEIPVIMRQLIG